MGSGHHGIGGCGTVMQHLLVIVNLLVFVGGVAVMAVGIWTLVDKDHFQRIVGDNMYNSSAVLLVVAGSVVALISFLGCYGSIKAIRCMLITYFVIVLVLFLLMLVAGILAYAFRDMVGSHLELQMRNTLSSYDSNAAVKTTWDSAQSELSCCGVAEAADWNGKVAEFPSSCCASSVTSCSPSTAHQTGCKNKVDSLVSSHAKVIGGVGIGIACIMILGLAFSLALYKMMD